MHPIKAILFDLDGVLTNTTQMHYETFRDAVEEVVPKYKLTRAEHEQRFEGMSTRSKLEILQKDGILQAHQFQTIFDKKQDLIVKRIPSVVQPRESLRLMLMTLNNQGFRLFCCSNSVRKTMDLLLTQLGIANLFEATYSNEDVKHPKPSPEIYELAMRRSFLLKEWCLIVEDSQVGRTAAYASGAHVLEVEDAEDVTMELLRDALYFLERRGTLYPRSTLYGRPVSLNILLSLDSIPIENLPHLIESFLPTTIPEEHLHLRFHIACGKSVIHTNRIDRLFWDVPSNVSYTYSLGNEWTQSIQYTDPVVYVNEEIPPQWTPDSFYKCLLNSSYDGVIQTRHQPDPYSKKDVSVKLNEEGLVVQVSSKQWLGPSAAIGIYGWRRSCSFFEMWKASIGSIDDQYTQAIQEGMTFRPLLCKTI
jgi:HAD superfamily hydrolase (TIGR01509 family)